MASSSRLFKPIKIGTHTLQNRVAMAPMTRYRATDNHIPLPYVADYYAQRASSPGTLLVTEATFISPFGGSSSNVPGIWNDEQIAVWRKVVEKVHEAGSVIFLQLWALGRTDDPEARKAAGTGDLVSSSAVALPREGAVVPREMTEAEIQQVIGEYATAATNAVKGAGFDGVEIHGANGYLPDQFTQDVVNKRTDKWGGSIENRSRFATEVVKAVVAAVGGDKTGIRFSPFSDFQAMKMKDPVPQFSHLLQQLKPLGLAYIHLVESRISGNADVESTEKNDPFIKLWDNSTPILLAGGFTPESALKAVDEEYREYDLSIVFGRRFIANPDLVYRIKNQIPLTQYDRGTFYAAQEPKGYLDYAFSDEWQREHGTVEAKA